MTTDGLLALKEGMSYEQVEALVGPPLCVTPNRPYRPGVPAAQTHCSRMPSSVQPELRNEDITLSFVERPFVWPFHPFQIYIHMANGHLTGAYVKYDDYGICCMDGLPRSPFYWIGSRELLRKEIGR